MIADAQLMFSDAQAVTADAASTNVIDLGASRAIGSGEPMAAVITVDVAADAASADETYTFIARSSATANLASPTDVATVTVARGALAAGYQVILPIPGGVDVLRYLGLYYDVGGTTPSMTVTAFLQPVSMISTFKTYADGITIS